MHGEVIADLKMVYYRGRYRAATAWSKVGKTSAAENPAIPGVGQTGPQKVVERFRKTSLRHQPVIYEAYL